jgi:hypothetical protein
MLSMPQRLRNATPDGSEQPGGDTPQENPRLSQMDEIAGRNMSEIETDLQAQGMKLFREGEQEAVKTDPPETQATATPPEDVDEQVTLQIGSDPIPVEQLDRVKVKMTVDGKERVLTVEDMRREAQFDGAARDRMRQATELLDQTRAAAAAQAATAETKNTTAATPTPPAGNDEKVGEGESASVAAKAKRIVSSVMEGDEDEAVKLMTEALLEGRRPSEAPTPKAEDLIQQLVPAVEQHLSQKKALESFAADFKEIVADPHLAEIADRNFQRAIKEDPQLSFSQALTKAGTDTRAWVQQFSPKPATEPAEPVQSRKLDERKSQIDNVSGLGTKATTVEEPVPNVSDTIAEMRKQRLAA